MVLAIEQLSVTTESTGLIIKPNILKLPQLTFTRFFAAIAIVFFHDQGHTYPFDLPIVQYWVSFSNVFVSYFFVLSGFILVISSALQGKLNVTKSVFWFNRFARIYPLYLFAMLMYLVLALLADTPNTTLRFDQLFLTTTLLQSWIPDYVMAYNYVSWSLSIELFFYLIFPLLLIILKKYRSLTILRLGVSMWLLSLFAFIYFKNHEFSKLFTDYFPLMHVNSFIGGVIGGFFFIKYRQTFIDNRKWILTIFLLLSVVAVSLIVVRNNFIKQYYHNGLFLPLFLSQILYLSCLEDNSKLKSILSHRVLQYLGEISYGIYILQVAFIILMMGLNKRFFHLQHTVIFYLYVVGLIIFCAICHEIIEKPCRIYLKIIFNRLQKKTRMSL